MQTPIENTKREYIINLYNNEINLKKKKKKKNLNKINFQDKNWINTRTEPVVVVWFLVEVVIYTTKSSLLFFLYRYIYIFKNCSFKKKDDTTFQLSD